MNYENYGKWFRSPPENFSSGAGNVPFDTSFMKRAYGSMEAPELCELVLHFRGNVTASGGAIEGEDYAKLYSQISVYDAGGAFFDRIPGTVARVIHQMERPGAHFDCDDLSSGSSDTTLEAYLPIVFEVDKASRGRDTAVELHRLIDGGGINVGFQTPSFFAFTGTPQVFIHARIRDNRRPEAKSRMVWRQQTISQTEADNYVVGGSLRAAFVTSNLATAAYTALATGLATVTSRNFEMIQEVFETLRERYRVLQQGAETGAVNQLDEFLAGNATPLITPYKDQNIGAMPDIANLHLQIVSVPTSAVLVTCRIEDRPAGLAAKTFNLTENEYRAAAAKFGVVVSAGSSSSPVAQWKDSVQRRLPLRLNAPGYMGK